MESCDPTSTSRGEVAGVAAVLVIAAGSAAGAAHTSRIGPVVAFAAAIFAALIAAWTADRRQARAQSAAAGLQEARLEREFAAALERQAADHATHSERLQASHTHDREAARLADLRLVIDDAAVALAQAEALIEAPELARLRGLAIPDVDLVSVHATTDSLRAALARLTVRFGRDAELVWAYRWVEALFRDVQATWWTQQGPASNEGPPYPREFFELSAVFFLAALDVLADPSATPERRHTVSWLTDDRADYAKGGTRGARAASGRLERVHRQSDGG